MAERKRESPERTHSSELTKLDGRVFFLTENPLQNRAQIEDGDLELRSITKLRDEVNTDLIIPSQWCMQHSDPENLGRYLLTGVEEIESGDIKRSKVGALVAGKSFGRGSSREHVQLALKGAGIKVVIADSCERIFEENCRNWGIFTLPLYSDVARKLVNVEIVVHEEIMNHYDEFSQDIFNHGGLLLYTKARLEG